MVNRLNETQKVGLPREGRTHLASPLKKRQDSQALVVSVGMKFHPFMKILWLSGVDPATPLPPLFLDQSENNFFWDHSFPPPPPTPYLKVWIWHWLCMANLSLYFSLVCSSICHKSLNTKRNIQMQVSKFSCWLPPVFVLQALFWSPSTVQC